MSARGCRFIFIVGLQVQSIATLATGIFSELNQLSPTLVAVSKTLVGMQYCHLLDLLGTMVLIT